MAINKKHEFDAEDVVLADFAKALSHPARIAIIRELAKRDTCICGDIVEVLPLAQSTVSQHLKELVNAGLVKGQIDGVKSCYCLHKENFDLTWSQLSELVSDLHKSIEAQNCC